MLKKWKLWYARRQLALAIKEEENARRYAKHLAETTIPVLEAALHKAEMVYLASDFLRGGK